MTPPKHRFRPKSITLSSVDEIEPIDENEIPPPCVIGRPIRSPVEKSEISRIFADFLTFNVPKLTAIIYAEFDKDYGPTVRYQVPENKQAISKETFNSFSALILPKEDLLNRMIKVIFKECKIIGHPIGLDCPTYPRGRHIFNMCFIVPKDSSADCMYEPLVQKLNEYLVDMEQECFFLTKRPEDVKGLMNQIFDKVNEKGECVIKVTDLTTMHLRLCPAYRGVEPPVVSLYMVPMLIRKIRTEEYDRIIEKMDVLSQKIIPEIDGVRCVREIAMKVSIDADLVLRCVRNLIFYECVQLVPLLLYANTYVATEKLHPFYHDQTLIQECLDFVGLQGSEVNPKYSDVFRLYLSLRCGMTLRKWVEAYDPRSYGVDERRFIQFGMFHRFLRKLSVYPLAKNRISCTGKLSRACDGTQSIEDLAVAHSIQPEILLELLTESNRFEFICK
ncbi:nprl-2 [Pristionchus pacificus]|uniref:Nitrogen permease regulator 2-like protein n=1 Tax=Pristionchus pacificus TaxID=54126 RepID=A0A8R1V4J5_PRIPA|nr:nprl-2 [Pristionchus pacificus]